MTISMVIWDMGWSGFQKSIWIIEWNGLGSFKHYKSFYIKQISMYCTYCIRITVNPSNSGSGGFEAHL